MEEKEQLLSQLTHLLNSTSDVYAIFDLTTGKYDFVSDNVKSLYGCPKEVYWLDPLFWKNCIHHEDVGGVEKEVKEIIRNKSCGEISYRIITPAGDKKILLEKLTVGKDRAGNAEKLYIVKTDYTNIENAEKSLVETERKFRFISENLSDFISIHDTDWNFTYASPAITNILGYLPAEIIGLGGLDLVHPDELVTILEGSLKPVVLNKKETRFRYRMRSKNGTYKWVETYSKPIIDAKNEISSIISSTRDVTDQVIAENKLRESEEQYRLLSENSNDIIAIHNLNKEFIYVSPSCKQLLGYDQAELLGKHPKDIFLKISDDSKEGDEVLLQKKNRKFITRAITKNGEEKLLEVWLKPLFKGEEVVALQSSTRDVTEREKLLGDLKQALAKERELNELREKFVSTASHQFRTPLTVIQSGVEIMDMYMDDLPAEKQTKFKRQFEKIQEEVGRLEHLMNDVLLLGRANAAQTPFHPQLGDLSAFCKNIIGNNFNNRYPAGRQVVFHVEGKEVPISFDPKLLGHAIENIINNAYKYSETGNIFLRLVYSPQTVELQVEDQGIGIPEDELKNLFDPFYRATNTTEIEGTGLGLSIVKEFVEKHGGKIFLSSKLNKGTVVSVILPTGKI